MEKSHKDALELADSLERFISTDTVEGRNFLLSTSVEVEEDDSAILEVQVFFWPNDRSYSASSSLGTVLFHKGEVFLELSRQFSDTESENLGSFGKDISQALTKRFFELATWVVQQPAEQFTTYFDETLNVREDAKS